MNQSPQHLIKLLLQHGFISKRAKGSQQVYFQQSSNKTVIVPVHGNKDIRKGTLLAILKQADIDKSLL
jgi:predicted RNA binding protein YcfA (HicA-like mRNA interferase family)